MRSRRVAQGDKKMWVPFSRFASVVLLTLSQAALAAAPQLLTPVRPASTVASAKSGGEGSPVRFNSDVVSNLRPGDEVALTLPDGSSHTYLSEKSIDQGGGFTTWVARSPISGDNERAIITYGPHGAWGWMRTPYGKFRIFPSGDGHDLVAPQAQQDRTPKFPGGDAIPVDADPPGIEHLKGSTTHVTPAFTTSPFEKAAPTPTVQADVMVIYTQDLADKLGVGLMPMIYNLIATANQAYVDSEVAFSIRLVNATLLNYSNSNGSSDTLASMRNAGTQNAAFQTLTWGVGSLRDNVGADFAAFIRDGPNDTGGIGNLLSNTAIYPAVNAVATTAYTVSNFCVQGCEEIFAHELGHNMGNHHDVGTIAKDTNGAGPFTGGVFPYSYGYYSCSGGLTCNPFTPNACGASYAYCAGNDANDFGTIMSYQNVKIMKFSNPLLANCVGPGGAGPGRACGGSEPGPAPAITANNALSMNQVRGSVGAYRNQVITNRPGSLQFTALSYSATEAAGSITFTVSRAQVDPGAGAVSVSYTVTGNTATAGVDFVAASGTLNWAAGDNANKTIVVTLVNDQAPEPIETMTASLSAPAGATGVYLGYPATASGIIIDSWPAGSIGSLPTAPAGWSTPVASSSPWAISNDSAPPGDADGLSLKSGLINFAVKNCTSTVYGAIPCPSIAQFSGTFVSGVVSFAYRLNAFPSFGFFEFLIDGTVAFSFTNPNSTAESGWQFAAVPIAAGAHTLQWQYRPALPFDCDGPSSPGIGPFPGCLDRAWIDQVALPLPLASSTTALGSSVNPSASGQSVTITATISGGAGTPTGTVRFLNGGTLITGCATLALSGGAAGCTTSALPPGANSIVAVYSGNTSYQNSSSGAFIQTVTSGPQLLTANPTTVAFGGQSMNTTAPPLTTTFTNSTASPVVVTGVTASAGYSVTHNCTTVAANGGTCTVTIYFTPPTGAATGPANGSVAVSYAGGGPTVATLTGTAEKTLVTHYYRSILRRAPDAGGKAFWEGEATRFQSIGANVNEAWFAMAQFFYASAEYTALNRDNNGFVTDLYNTFFNRPPDAGGLAFWAAQLTSGLPREVALAGFMFSPEFVSFTQAIFGNTAARAEVDTVMDFYRGLLARTPDQSGYDFWVAKFRAAQCAGAGNVYGQVESISSSFANGGEYTGKNRTNAQYVGDLYNAFLRRGGDLAGVNFWIGQLATLSRNQVRQQFIGSTEFQGRVTNIVNQGCLP